MRICKIPAVGVFLAVISSVSFAQVKMPSTPEMPFITNVSDAPAMPRISAPTFGSTFYVPGNVYTGKHGDIQIKNAETRSDTTELSASDSTAEKLAAVFGLGSGAERLTATDISMLDTKGYFGGIYSLLGTGATSGSSVNASSSSELLLKKVVEKLEALKIQNSELTKMYSDSRNYKAASTVPASSENEPKILRFVVNGRNILDTCRTVYFSTKEYDGSFLLTGDRKFDSNGKSREETFYLLFKADGNCGTESGYNVEPKLIQDSRNEYSFLYWLSKKHNLKAEKTGNLVSLRSVEPAWNMDLLLDIGSE